MSIPGQSHIDTLLERYLGLIDEYSQLREDLSRLQRGMFQDIARANFSAERGVRYGRVVMIPAADRGGKPHAHTHAHTHQKR